MEWGILCRLLEKMAHRLGMKDVKKNQEKRQRAKRRKVGFWYGDNGWPGNVVESRNTIALDSSFKVVESMSAVI